LAGLILSACTTTAEQFEGVREVVKGSPALRQEGIATCIRDTRMTPENRRIGAALMNIGPDSDVERTACTRMMAGLVSGRLTHEDIFSVPLRMTPKLVRVLQNR
jgi:hypothetical protein